MTRYVIVNEDYLQHHGILNMHWGIRRFQPYPKGYKGNGKEVGEAAKVKQRTSKKEMRKQKKSLKKSIRETDRQLKGNNKVLKDYEEDYQKVRNDPKAEKMIQQAAEKKKQKAIASGDLNKILKYREQMSNQELEDAIKRTKLLNEIKELSASEKKNAKNSFDKAVNNSSKKDKKNKKDKNDNKENLMDKSFNKMDKTQKRLNNVLKLVNTTVALAMVYNTNKSKLDTRNVKKDVLGKIGMSLGEYDKKKTEKQVIDEVLKNLDMSLDDYNKKKRS